MGQALAQWEERTRQLLGNLSAAILPTPDVEAAIRAAVRQHSASLPRLTSADFPGNGSSFDLAISSMTGWVQGFSRVEAIEYPQGQRQPIYLDAQSWRLYPSDSAPTFVRLLIDTPSSGTTARVYYSVPWPLPDTNAATDKLPDTDFEALCHLVGCISAQGLADRASGNTSPSIPAASAVVRESEGDRWAKRADELCEFYNDHFGGVGGIGAEAITDWDATATFIETGGRFLFRSVRR